MQTTESVAAIPASAFFDRQIREFLRPVEPALGKLLQLDRLIGTFAAAAGTRNGRSVFENLLNELDIHVQAAAEDLARIPADGPAVLVANHPFGLLEGVILSALLPKIRPDAKFMANTMLRAVPQLADLCIFVNPFGGVEAKRENRGPLRECMAWLKGGGMLVVFPAGEVAHLDWHERTVTDPPWSSTIARLIRHANCPVIPMFFSGANSVGFQLLGTVHASLRTANLPRELLNKRGKSIEVRTGQRISAAQLAALPDDQAAIDYLRCRTYLLHRRSVVAHEPMIRLRRRTPAAIEQAADPAKIEAEIQRLAPEQRICGNEEMSAYLATAEEIPHSLREIGRLRELTFRAVGEGTGDALDLDRFDAAYQHLFLWHHGNREIAGAYRLGATPDLIPRLGVRGLYTSTLFRYEAEFFHRIGPAIELGRSFVRTEYQRQYAPLLLLWKGISHYVARRKDCPVLFGAVSISNDYNPVSRDLLVRFLEKHQPRELARLVRPRRPYHRRPFDGYHVSWLCRFIEDLDELSGPISDLEPDGKGVPILVRQYVKLGGRMLGFNVDPRFANALDGLILVDLRETPAGVLSRYMSREGAAEFLRHHQRL